MTWLYRSSVIISSTCSVPNSTTRPTSLRARSTSITCSACSFGCSTQLGAHAAVLLVGAPAPTGARDRAGDHRAVEELHHGLGRRADEREARLPDEVHVRARVDLAQHAVDVEGVGVEVEVVALGQHHLEDVAGEDVLLGHLHGAPVRLAPHRGAHLRERIVGIGRFDERLVERAAAVSGQLVEAGQRGVVPRVELRVGQPGLYEDVLDEAHPLAPVVVGRQLPDHGQHRVRVAEVVRGHVGQVLDLAHDVVPEVPEHTAVQRGQVLQRRRPPGGQQHLQCGEDALVERDARRQGAGHLDGATAGGQRGDGVAPDERPPAPALAVLDGLEQEPRLVADQTGERRDRGGEVAQHLAPHRDDRVRPGQLPERVAVGAQGHPKDRKKQVRSPVWHAPLPSCSTTNRSASPSQS